MQDLTTKFEYLDLLEAFDAEMPLSKHELGEYWFRSLREDGFSVLLTFNIYETTAGIVVKSERNGAAICNVAVKRCHTITVLDKKKRIVEISGENLRVLVCVIGDLVVDVQTS